MNPKLVHLTWLTLICILALTSAHIPSIPLRWLLYITYYQNALFIKPKQLCKIKMSAVHALRQVFCIFNRENVIILCLVFPQIEYSSAELCSVLLLIFSFDVRYYTFLRIYFEWLLFNFKTFSIPRNETREEKREMYFPIHFVITCVCVSECYVLRKMLRENKVTLQQKCLLHLLRVIFDIFLALFLCISF